MMFVERIGCRMGAAIVVILVMLSLVGCKTKYIPVDNVMYREVTKHDTLHTSDRVWIHDSIHSSQKGDTVFLDKWHKEIVLKNVYNSRTDSFVRRDSIPVPYPVEKELSKWERFQLKYAIWSFGALCALLVLLCYKLFKRTRNAKCNHND